jgi:hypothetical protein
VDHESSLPPVNEVDPDFIARDPYIFDLAIIE